MSQQAIGQMQTVPAGAYLEIEFQAGSVWTPDTASIEAAVNAAGYNVVNATVKQGLFGGPVIDVFILTGQSDLAGNIGNAIASALSSYFTLTFAFSPTNYWLVDQTTAGQGGPASNSPSVSSTIYVASLAIIIVVAGYFLIQAEHIA